MFAYLIRRLLLIVPTLLGIMAINFAVVQLAPGGPLERMIAQLQGLNVSATARIDSSSQHVVNDTSGQASEPRWNLDPEIIKALEKQYGYDKPPVTRFFIMLGNYLRFDFGESFFQDTPVIELIISKLPVSISLGLWSMLLIYLISIPLGIAKALREGSRFDDWSSSVIIIGNAIPSFLFAILLLILFAGGRYFDWFPLRGLVSDDWQTLNTWHKILDYFWHLCLPLFAMVIGGFAGITLLTRNSFLEHIRKKYVMTAYGKGASVNRVLYGHVFRNAMLVIIAGFPATFIATLFTSATFIEIIFSLDGLGLLTYEAVINRDYPVFFATLYIFSLLALLLKILNDFAYSWVDPRIDFETR